MAVKAKFSVERVESNKWPGNSQSDTVHLRAVYGPGNEEWASASPSGSMQIVVANKAALEQLKPGAEFLLTFEHAPCSRITPGAPMCEQLSGHDGPCGKRA